MKFRKELTLEFILMIASCLLFFPQVAVKILCYYDGEHIYLRNTKYWLILPIMYKPSDLNLIDYWRT